MSSTRQAALRLRTPIVVAVLLAALVLSLFAFERSGSGPVLSSPLGHRSEQRGGAPGAGPLGHNTEDTEREERAEERRRDCRELRRELREARREGDEREAERIRRKIERKCRPPS
jgi:hypothetical protein